MEKDQIADLSITSIISLSFVISFLYVRFDALKSTSKYFVALLIAWVVLELLAFVLVALQVNEAIDLPSYMSGSLYDILVLVSLWGIGTIQVSEELSTRHIPVLRYPRRFLLLYLQLA
jgi:hypothetical protein